MTRNGPRAAKPCGAAGRGRGTPGNMLLAPAACRPSQSMSLMMQQCLNFLPLPQGQGAFRDIFFPDIANPLPTGLGEGPTGSGYRRTRDPDGTRLTTSKQRIR